MSDAQEIEKADRETDVEWEDIYMELGRVHALMGVSLACNNQVIKWYRRMKEDKPYEKHGFNLDQLCKRIGTSRRALNERLLFEDRLGGQFVESWIETDLPYTHMRYLLSGLKQGDLNISEGKIEVGDQKIPIDADHREEIQAAIDDLKQKKKDAENRRDRAERLNKGSLKDLEEERKKNEDLTREITRLKGEMLTCDEVEKKLKEFLGRFEQLNEEIMAFCQQLDRSSHRSKTVLSNDSR